MSSNKFSDAAEQLATDLAEEGIDADVDEIEADMVEAHEKYRLDEDEAIRTVVENRSPSESDISALVGNSNEVITIDELEAAHINASDSAWVTLDAVQVMGTWDVDHSSIQQKAEIADSTGRCQVTVWAADGQPTFEEGDVVRLENVPTDEYQGNYSVKIAPEQSVVEAVDADVDPADNNIIASGRVVNADDGLIRRCGHEDCTRTLDDGRCEEHGEVDHEDDLRLKVVIDDGQDAYRALLNREAVETLTGMTLDEAVTMAQDALDRDVPSGEMQDAILGSELAVEGPEMYGYILAEEFGTIESVEADTVDAALQKARKARPDNF